MTKLAPPTPDKITTDEKIPEKFANPRRGETWSNFAGIWKDNPDFDAFAANVAALRAERDEDERRS